MLNLNVFSLHPLLVRYETCNLVRDDLPIQVVLVVICLILFQARMNIFVIIKVMILLLVNWSYIFFTHKCAKNGCATSEWFLMVEWTGTTKSSIQIGFHVQVWLLETIFLGQVSFHRRHPWEFAWHWPYNVPTLIQANLNVHKFPNEWYLRHKHYQEEEELRSLLEAGVNRVFVHRTS